MSKTAVVTVTQCSECPYCIIVEAGGLWMPPLCRCSQEDRYIRKLKEVPDWCPLPDKFCKETTIYFESFDRARSFFDTFPYEGFTRDGSKVIVTFPNEEFDNVGELIDLVGEDKIG